MYSFNQRSLMIALKAFQRYVISLRQTNEAMVDFFQGFAAVEIRLSGAEKIQVGSMQDQDPALGWFVLFVLPRHEASLPQLGAVCPFSPHFPAFWLSSLEQ